MKNSIEILEFFKLELHKTTLNFQLETEKKKNEEQKLFLKDVFFKKKTKGFYINF
jgi:hypothetical protein